MIIKFKLEGYSYLNENIDQIKPRYLIECKLCRATWLSWVTFWNIIQGQYWKEPVEENEHLNGTFKKYVNGMMLIYIKHGLGACVA